ncbi:Uncharacterized protein F44E2.2 [Lasius niger]|uniref:Uncharacterized protein F44E2.2 n=1 Tax=Lasius niger TaxID=67767 RepID=A0A0J7K2C2_LASNI|nr:Uncharacterized protein F44E2.2 [Lasius niger]
MDTQHPLNTAIHDATGFTPAYLNHGRELNLPQPAPAPLDPGDHAPDAIRQRLEDAWTLTRIRLARAFQRQERHYNLRRRDWKPSVGDYVWKREYPLSNKAGAFNSKLAPKYSGPWEVRRIISPVIVDLRNARGKWYRHIHVQDLKPAPENNYNTNGKRKETDGNNTDAEDGDDTPTTNE